MVARAGLPALSSAACSLCGGVPRWNTGVAIVAWVRREPGAFRQPVHGRHPSALEQAQWLRLQQEDDPPARL